MSKTDQTSKTAGAGSRWRIAAGLAAVCLVVLIAADLLTGLIVTKTRLVSEIVDIQSPETLCLKIEALKRFQGEKVLVLGDSLAFGRAMLEHGDKDWRRHDLASALEDALRRRRPEKPILALNLGLNGGLPADQLAIARLLRGAKLDLIVMTAGIRAFSTDFAKPDKANSRKWLGELGADDLPACRLGATSETALDAAIAGKLADHSWLSRSRIFWNDYLFGGSLKTYAEDLRKAWQRALVPKPLASKALVPTAIPAQLQVLLLAKGRFARIAFAEPHAQVAAFRELRALLPDIARRTVIVYGQENPKLRRRLISKRKYRRHRAALASLVRPDGKVAYITDTKIPPEQYLDYVHVNATAYKTMAQQIAAAISAPAQ